MSAGHDHVEETHEGPKVLAVSDRNVQIAKWYFMRSRSHVRKRAKMGR